MTKAKKLRKFTIKMKAEFGVGSYSNFKESEITVIETTLLIEELRAVRGCLEAYKKCSGFPEYASETLTKLDSLIKEIENE